MYSVLNMFKKNQGNAGYNGKLAYVPFAHLALHVDSAATAAAAASVRRQENRLHLMAPRLHGTLLWRGVGHLRRRSFRYMAIHISLADSYPSNSSPTISWILDQEVLLAPKLYVNLSCMTHGSLSGHVPSRLAHMEHQWRWCVAIPLRFLYKRQEMIQRTIHPP